LLAATHLGGKHKAESRQVGHARTIALIRAASFEPAIAKATKRSLATTRR
jgi:hypothetical protein